jgi:hypothetical protein
MIVREREREREKEIKASEILLKEALSLTDKRV